MGCGDASAGAGPGGHPEITVFVERSAWGAGQNHAGQAASCKVGGERRESNQVGGRCDPTTNRPRSGWELKPLRRAKETHEGGGEEDEEVGEAGGAGGALGLWGHIRGGDWGERCTGGAEPPRSTP